MLAVTVTSFLIALTVQFNKDMRQELVGSSTVKENSQLGAIIKSAYNLAEAVLLKDVEDNDFDSAYDRWAKLTGRNLSGLFYRGTLELTVTDLAGKLQLNSLGSTSQQVAESGREALQNLLDTGEFGDFSTEEVNLIVDAITDWVDENDDEVGIEETESSFYQSLQPSYSCKNSPFEFLEELLLVRGITRDLYFGTAEYKGLRGFVTVQGSDGKININSAPAEILLAINRDMTEELASQMIEFRSDEGNKDLLGELNWYEDSSGQWPGDVKFDPKKITTASNYFTITARAKYGEIERTLKAVVRRDSDEKISLLSRKVE